MRILVRSIESDLLNQAVKESLISRSLCVKRKSS